MLELVIGATVACISAGIIGVLWRQLSDAKGRLRELSRESEEGRAQYKQVEDLVSSLEDENEWLREEIDKRCQMNRKVYRILTVGISGTGKTALTLKWANPRFDLRRLEGSKLDRYQRTVSHVANKEVLTEHVFAIDDYGGEHLVDACQQAMNEEVHALLLVVDLAPSDRENEGAPAEAPRNVDTKRVERQLREFQPEVLRFFFGPKMMAACKTVVLFINKSDVLSGTPSEVERVARAHYDKLIKALQQYSDRIDVEVFVGSATSGHSIHHLFSHFVHKILPPSAFDDQLLQRMATHPQAEKRNGEIE